MEPIKTEAPVLVSLVSSEIQLIVQLLERSPAANKETIAIKHGLITKLLPHLPDGQ